MVSALGVLLTPQNEPSQVLLLQRWQLRHRVDCWHPVNGVRKGWSGVCAPDVPHSCGHLESQAPDSSRLHPGTEQGTGMGSHRAAGLMAVSEA